jgi:glycosyltransferase involved in cell wall biosynthesis
MSPPPVSFKSFDIVKEIKIGKLDVLAFETPNVTETLQAESIASSSLQDSLQLSIITQYYPPDYAATGQLIEELALQLRQQGIKVRIFSGQPAYAFNKESAPSVERLGNLLVMRSRASRLWSNRIRGKALNGLFFFIRAGSHLLRSQNRGDVLLLPTTPPFLPVLGYLLNCFLGVDYICLLYDVYPDIAVQLKVVPSKHWLVRLWNAINLRVWRRAARVIVLSSSMGDRIVSKHPELANKIAVVHNWADPSWIVPCTKHNNWFALEQKLTDVFTVLYSGNMGRCHDMDTIIDTAYQLRHESIRFVFIGGGAQREACVEQLRQLGVTNCLFLPYQDKQVLPYSLTACDLALVSVKPNMASLVAPSKLYSALAAGRPIAVICEPASYLHQIVQDSHCGAAFDNGDSAGLAKFIRQLAANTDLVQQMGTAGRQYLQKHFTPEAISQQYADILREVAGRKASEE